MRNSYRVLRQLGTVGVTPGNQVGTLDHSQVLQVYTYHSIPTVNPVLLELGKSSLVGKPQGHLRML